MSTNKFANPNMTLNRNNPWQPIRVYPNPTELD